MRLTDAAGSVVVQAVVQDGGAISLTVPARPDPTPYRLEVLSPAGAVEGSLDIVAITDTDPPEISFDTAPPQATAHAGFRLEVQVGDAVSVRLNGADLAFAKGKATLETTLADGTNTFEIAAQDLVGNVQLRTVAVILDAEPPVITATTVTRPDGPQGPIIIEAIAKDNVGLRAAARYRIAVNDAEEPGVLRCDGLTGRCTTTLPPREGTVTLKSVTVEDYAGNKTEKTEN